MLRATVVRPPRASYYASRRADGSPLLAPGESPGQWTGDGAWRLGLHGTVDADHFDALLHGHDPWGERPLRHTHHPRSVGGIDLVWCPPKSVSVLHLLGPHELGLAAGQAHHTAVADATDYLERQAIGVRRTVRGAVVHARANGMVGAAFTHRTSRDLDPHLHTHLVVAASAQGPDGLWSALDTRRLFAHRRVASALYDARLRRELTQSAGVDWERLPSGRWDMVGGSPMLCRLFSQRTAAVDQALQRRSWSQTPEARSSPRARRMAFLIDRPDKEVEARWDEIREEWRHRARNFGLDPSELIAVVGRADRRWPPAQVAADVEHGAAASMSLESVGDQRHRHRLIDVAEASRWGMTVAEAEHVTGGASPTRDPDSRVPPSHQRRSLAGKDRPVQGRHRDGGRSLTPERAPEIGRDSLGRR